MTATPQEIPDGDHEVVIERAAAVDVAKVTGTVCVRLPGKSGRRFSRVWEVSARTGAIGELAQQLRQQGIEKVTVESTSDYWRIWYYLLEDQGLDVQLVNARDVKNVPGRPKTDKLDALWLAKLTEKGLLRPSFVPPAPIRRLRDYTRLREDLTRERSRYWQRLEKLLEDAAIKVSAVASTLDTLSTRDMIEALIAGQRDPRRLADLARGRMKTKRSELIAALDGRFDDHHAELARMLLGQIDALCAQIDTLTARIEELIAELPDDAVAIDSSGSGDGPGTSAGAGTDADPDAGGSDSAPLDPAPAADDLPGVIGRLDEIPGIGQRAAQAIIAEIGLDMSRFPTPEHLVSWARLCPRTIQSGPITRGGKTGKGNPYLKGALGEAAVAAAKTDTFLGERYRRIVKRRGKLKALVAVARSILVVIWHLLSNPAARFCDLGSDYHTNRVAVERRVRNHIAQLTAMGYRVTLQAAA
ncbi:IS110 family transposase [Mycobacterium sp. SM1]|uniref:IS110 family transposase n=1 Tax=Mycobacterium sp. SM1 TaxID=2816243 RepID=UPI001BD1AE40|nr:IS110 family transposase [Mycobacterium sp. SM1]MBS4730641.1 IS110 family transposase [Mycobacterium sp. SM1]